MTLFATRMAVVGTALGALAQIENAVWPLYAMILLNAMTLVFVARLPAEPDTVTRPARA